MLTGNVQVEAGTAGGYLGATVWCGVNRFQHAETYQTLIQIAGNRSFVELFRKPVLAIR